jgi:hypothetical protein
LTCIFFIVYNNNEGDRQRRRWRRKTIEHHIFPFDVFIITS